MPADIPTTKNLIIKKCDAIIFIIAELQTLLLWLF